MLQMPAPPPGTFAPNHAAYLALVPPERHLTILETQPQELAEFLAPLDGDFRYADGKWSIKEVVGHITDTERVLAYRLLSFARGEQRSLPGFDQDAFVAEGCFGARSLADLLEEFRLVRLSSLALLQGLPPASLERIGQANDKPIGVIALGYLIPGHAAHHIQVLRERYAPK
ncbi:MAG: damage-inducible protein DinB [Holophagaceae bacterium]|nr:damage-inducible protein DinB [Holophagaceae bacterium]